MKSEPKKFIHLRNYSQYSLSRGAVKINELVKLCSEKKIPATSITDFNNLFGSMEFSIECQKSGVQPIIGCNIFLSTNNFVDGYLLLIAKDEFGFENLSKLVSISYLENSNSSNPFISLKNLKDHCEGLICMGGGESGVITKNFLNADYVKTSKLISLLSETYQKDFFLEIQRDNKKSFLYENFLIETSNKKKIPLVATNENYFLEKSYFNTHDALLSISQQKYLDSENRMKSSIDYHFKSSNEMFDLFKDIPDACLNTIGISKKCSLLIKEKKPRMPKLNFNGSNEDTELKKKSMEGLLTRLKTITNLINKNEYFKRLDYELEVIIRMGYASYFLIVSDFINWAKQNDVPVGPGRGSGAGSLVAWSLSITNLNPIKFGLLFERFLNPERVSLPDFDIDFCMDKRDEVIRYVQEKYGKSKVAQIITFGSFQARAALRDVGRVMQLPLPQIDEFCKMFPYNPAQPTNLTDIINNDDNLKKIFKNDPNIENLFKISRNLEGLFRHASTHAAGIVIADQPLEKIIPLYKDPKSDIPVTQFSMKYVEKMGLIKFDFLGLKTLTVINETCKYLKKRSIEIDINNIPLDDFKTFQLLKNGNTTGIFQLEGQGMRETLKKIIPDRFEDLIAIVSLFRPGPMDNIPTFINRKQNKEKYEYLHPDLKNILEETYGIMVYQEQVMLIAQKIAGFSLAKADLLRRAMGKKIKSEMSAQKSNFLEGCIKNNLEKKKAIKLFNEIEKFAGYGFNKSHAASYAMIAYQTAYLKANYPSEFLCALMNCDIGNFEKISGYCNELKKFGFQIFNPDVNTSDTFFKVIYDEGFVPLGINYGLSAIKNVGETSIFELLKERNKNGEFKNILDLLKRVNNSILNKKILEALVFSNSLFSLEKNQNYLSDNIEKLLSFNANYHKNFIKNQTNLFSDDLDKDQFSSANYKQCDNNQKLNMELDAFGFYLSDHPSKLYKNSYVGHNISDIDMLHEESSKAEIKNEIFSCIALISDLRERMSKIGKKFCFLNLSDNTGDLDVICFSEVLNNINFQLKAGKTYLFQLVLQKMKESNRFMVKNVLDIDNFLANANNYNVLLNPDDLDHKKLGNLLKHTEQGRNKILFKMIVSNCEVKINCKQSFKIDSDFLDNLRNVTGVMNVNQTNKKSS